METQQGEGPIAGIEQLYARFCELATSADGNAPPLRELLLSPASEAKLNAACAAILKQAAQSRGLLADLKQETYLVVCSQFQERSIPFQDRGSQRFEGWLWMLWYNAARKAWRALRRDLAPCAGFLLHARESATADTGFDEDRWQWILLAIDRLADDDLRETMLDWREGLTPAESAARRGVAVTSIRRYRVRGCTVLRAKYDRENSQPLGELGVVFEVLPTKHRPSVMP